MKAATIANRWSDFEAVGVILDTFVEADRV